MSNKRKWMNVGFCIFLTIMFLVGGLITKNIQYLGFGVIGVIGTVLLIVDIKRKTGKIL
jgi:hypothetical protein